VPGLGEMNTEFNDRGLQIWKDSEYASPNYYRVVMEDEDVGLVLAEMSASEFPPIRRRFAERWVQSRQRRKE
jgi:hypothetical protein